MDDAAEGHDVTLRRVSEIHRETTSEHDERLLLLGVHMTTTLRPRLVAPHVRPSALEVRELLEFGDVTSRLARFMRARGPLKLVWQDDGKRHAWHDIRRHIGVTHPRRVVRRSG